MPRKQMPAIARDEAVALYRGGRSMSSLARKYGVSAGRLTRRFREWGEPVRDHAAAQRARRGMTLAEWRRRVDLPP
ncbi:hypothetical protein [Streptomyces sp. B6B3]|uniref:hypothetical protein n=1 Tax=Streptomyces sp. B6B3 TaxID=3153570 RepID=UPI00325D8A30